MKRAGIRGLVAAVLLGFAPMGAAHAQEDPVKIAMALLETDPAGARAILAPAAEAGHVGAMYTLAAMLATGTGGETDAAAARDWYHRAAVKGSVRATRSLGMMLATGEGGEADPARGIALLQLAADAGDLNAIDLLSLIPDDAAQMEDVDAAREAWLAKHGAPAN